MRVGQQRISDRGIPGALGSRRNPVSKGKVERVWKTMDIGHRCSLGTTPMNTYTHLCFILAPRDTAYHSE